MTEKQNTGMKHPCFDFDFFTPLQHTNILYLSNPLLVQIEAFNKRSCGIQPYKRMLLINILRKEENVGNQETFPFPKLLPKGILLQIVKQWIV